MKNILLIPIVLVILSSCAGVERKISKQVGKYEKQGYNVLSSGVDQNEVPFIILTDGEKLYVDSLNTKGMNPLVSADSPVSLITHCLGFGNRGELVIKQKQSLPKPFKEIAGIPSSDFFNRFDCLAIPSTQGVVFKDHEDMYYYYTLSTPDQVYGFYDIDETTLLAQSLFKTPLIGNLNVYDYWNDYWDYHSLKEVFQEQDHLFFIMTSFDSHVSLVSFANELNYHKRFYPISELRITESDLVRNVEADLRVAIVERAKPPVVYQETQDNRKNARGQKKQSANEIDEVMTVLNALGEFGLFTEEINEINQVMRIIDLFL